MRHSISLNEAQETMLDKLEQNFGVVFQELCRQALTEKYLKMMPAYTQKPAKAVDPKEAMTNEEYVKNLLPHARIIGSEVHFYTMTMDKTIPLEQIKKGDDAKAYEWQSEQAVAEYYSSPEWQQHSARKEFIEAYITWQQQDFLLNLYQIIK